MRIKDPLFLLGMLSISFWILDSLNKIFILHKPYLMIWYSSVGLLLTAIGLIRKNSFLLSSMFCALLLIESMWLISFFTILIVHHPITPIANYAFAADFPRFEFFTTLYHILLVPSVVFALTLIKKVHPLGWLGAFIFATGVSLIALLITPNNDNVNCIYAPCEELFNHLYQYPNPWRIFLATISLTFFVYLPLNIATLKLAKRFKWNSTLPERRLGRQNIHLGF